jgi:hypothetical protein
MHARSRGVNKQVLNRALVWGGTPLALLVAGEFALRGADFEYVCDARRAIVWTAEKDKLIESGKIPYRFDPHQLWAPRPGAVLSWTNGERINPDGYRGPQLDVERPKDTLRIATLGGAATLGVGVRWEDTYSALIARFVSERVTRCEVLCAGAEDFSIRQSVQRYANLVRPYRPHLVILAISGGVSVAQAAGGLTDAQKIQRQDTFDRGDPGGGCARDSLRVMHLAEWMHDVLDGSYWVEREFEFEQSRLESSIGSIEWPGARRVPIDDFYSSLSLLLQMTRQDGAHLIILSIPRSPALPELPVMDVYARTVTEFAQRERLIYFDGRDAYLQALRDDVKKEDLFLEDLYPSECGHLQLAEALADTIARGIASKSSNAPALTGGESATRK